jgi:hypothetical protein
MTAVELRQKYDGEGMLQRFREDLVLPHLATLRTFSPLSIALSRGQERGENLEVRTSDPVFASAPAVPRPLG